MDPPACAGASGTETVAKMAAEEERRRAAFWEERMRAV